MQTVKLSKIVKIGLGITTQTYIQILLIYPYGDDRFSFTHVAVFGRN